MSFHYYLVCLGKDSSRRKSEHTAFGMLELKLMGLFNRVIRQPIPVNLTRKNLKGELEGAINSTYFHQNQGTNSCVLKSLLYCYCSFLTEF